MLPTWLYFDSLTHSLEGVAGTEELKISTYSLEVTAMQQSVGDAMTHAKDTFNIRISDYSVYDEVGINSGIRPVPKSGDRPIRCPAGSAVTSVAVIIDADYSLLSSRDNVKILKSMSRHLDLPVAAFRFVPSSSGAAALMDSSALVAGPGDVTLAMHKGVSLEWEVGCGYVLAPHMDTLQRVELTGKDGTMAKAIGHGVVGWHVTNRKAPGGMGSRLKKRQAVPRARPSQTLQPTVSVPTSREIAPTRTVDEPIRVVPTQTVPSLVVPPRADSTVDTPKPTRAGRNRTRVTRPTVVTPTAASPIDSKTSKSSVYPDTKPDGLEPSRSTVPTTTLKHIPTAGFYF